MKPETTPDSPDSKTRRSYKRGERGTFQIVPFKYPSGEDAYRVTGVKTTGERVRENFATLAAAEGRRQRLQIESTNATTDLAIQATRLSNAQLRDAEAAFAKLDGRHGLGQVVAYFLENYREADRSSTVADAFTKFIAERKAANLRPLSIRNLEMKCDELVKTFGARQVAEVNADALRGIIFKPTRGPKSRDNHRRALNAFFEWSRKQGFCAVNPVAVINPIKADRHEPAILSPEEAERLLRAAQAHKAGVLVPYVALGVFAGLRPTELARLSWEKIDLASKTVTIGSDVAKMRGRRVVEMADNLVEWLRPFAKAKKPLVASNWRKDFDAVKEAAGFGTPSEDKPTLKPWTQDIMRHSAISYHLAKHQHEGKTATWAGNSPDIIQRHYKGLVTPAAVEKFWDIGPKAKKPAKGKAEAKASPQNVIDLATAAKSARKTQHRKAAVG